MERIFCTSDLHVDYMENLKWVENLSEEDYREDVLIVAGDICHQKEMILQVFRLLVRKFKEVCFVPGNHDLWVLDEKNSDSWAKFNWILEVARNEGVCMEPLELDRWEIIPLFSWFDFSFGKANDRLQRLWRDFRAVKWPETWTQEQAAAQFHARNELVARKPGKKRITFSHFVPFTWCLPAIPIARYLRPVLGSGTLGGHVRELGPDCHIFGHFHMNRSKTVGHTLFLDNALGYPKETFLKRKLVEINAFFPGE